MSSGFVTEDEIEKRRVERQAEWEKVRKEEDPEDAPEEVYDHRSLFERLEEQRVKKQNEWDEEHKFKNQFRGLDDEEVDFLDKIEDIRTEAERRRIMEEKMELEEYQRKQNLIKEQEIHDRLRAEMKGPDIKRSAGRFSGSKSKQQQLLMGVVKRKSSESSQPEEKRQKTESVDSPAKVPEQTTKKSPLRQASEILAKNGKICLVTQASAGKPLGLGLLGEYGSDTDSE